MAEARTLCQRAGCPGGLACSKQQVVERRTRQACKTNDEARCAMAKLQQHLGIARPVELRTPVGPVAKAVRGALNGIHDAAFPRIPILDTQEVPAPDERQRRGNKSM